MMKKYWFLPLLLVCTTPSIVPAWAAPTMEGVVTNPPINRIVWNKTPIPLRLTLNQERLVHFPAPVKVGIPATLETVLDIMSVDGTVYMQGKAPFSPTRVQVQEVESGRLYLLDVSAGKDGGDNSALTVTAPSTAASHSKGQRAGNTQDESEDGFIDYITLTRFAAQQLYAPARLIQDVPGIWPAQSPRRTPVPLVRGGAIEAIPVAAWRSRDYYLTAVRLRNLSDRPVIVDPSCRMHMPAVTMAHTHSDGSLAPCHDLRGTWLSATPHHSRLLPHGDEADTTALYLISVRPFNEILIGENEERGTP